MKVSPTEISDVLVLEPKVFEDERGFFMETYNQNTFRELGIDYGFVQDNHSRSVKNVLRGLHYQLPPKAQGKLVRAVVGEIFDVALDIRENSPTLGKWVGEKLSAENKKMLWIPPGFAHGFLALSDEAEVFYKATDFYSPDCERCIFWDDSSINIDWCCPVKPIISKKDQEGRFFLEAELF